MRTGVHIEFLASNVLSWMTSKERMARILDGVKDGKILVLETPLSGEEQRELILHTMNAVTEDFPGIEVSTLGGEEAGFRGLAIRMLGGKTSGLTVVGPASVVSELQKHPEGMVLRAGRTEKER